MKILNVLKNAGKWIFFAMVAFALVLIVGIYSQITDKDSLNEQDLKEALARFGNDLNEIREYLYLPQHEYDFFNDAETETSLPTETDEDTDYLSGVMKFTQMLTDEKEVLKQQEETRRLMDELLREPRFATELKELNLAAAKTLETDEQYVKLKLLSGRETVAQLVAEPMTSSFMMQSILGNEVIHISPDATLRDAVMNYLSEKAPTIIEVKTAIAEKQTQTTDLWKEAEIQDLMSANTLSLNPEPVETEAGFEYYVTNLEESPLLTLKINRKDGKWSMNDQTFDSLEVLRPAILKALKVLDGQTENMKELSQRRQNLETYLASEEFVKLLEKNVMQMLPAREDGERVYYDLVYTGYGTEEKMGSIIFDQVTGEVSFLKEGDEVESSLEDVLYGSKKKP